MSNLDILRSFAETRTENEELLPEAAFTYGTLRGALKGLEAKLAAANAQLADYTRRSECGESKFGWIGGERILDLEVKITEMQIELDHCRDVAGKVEDVDRENVDLKTKLAELRGAQMDAFVAGAKWWEYKKEGATMWNSDQNKALFEAQRRYAIDAAKGG